MTVIDDYLAPLGAPEKRELEKIRAIIHDVVPEAEEVKTYGMPGFKYKGKYLISFASFKDHLSIFPGAEAIEVFKDDLKNYKTSKGTAQFTLDHPLSDGLVAAMVRLRADAIDSGKKGY